jgi:hypothetical protein
VDLNGRAYNLPGDIILAGVQIAAPLIDFCQGISPSTYDRSGLRNKTAESRERAEDERTETTIYPGSNWWAFQVWMEDKER